MFGFVIGLRPELREVTDFLLVVGRLVIVLVPGLVGRVAGRVDGLVAGFVVGLVFGFAFGWGFGWALGFALGLLFGCAFGRLFGLALGLLFGLGWAFGFGWAFGLAFDFGAARFADRLFEDRAELAFLPDRDAGLALGFDRVGADFADDGLVAEDFLAAFFPPLSIEPPLDFFGLEIMSPTVPD